LNKKATIVNQATDNHLYGNAGCIVKKEGHILVVKLRKIEKWDIPAGKPLPGESASDTAKRETLEEAGVKVQIVRLLYFIEAPKEGNLYIYEAVPLNKTLPLNTPLKINSLQVQEIREARFLPIDELNQGNFRYPAILPKVIDLFQSINC